MNPVALNTLKRTHLNLVTLLGVPANRLFLVGGCVRDAAAGVQPKDYDCVVLNDMVEPWDDCTSFALAERIARIARAVGAKVAVYQAYGNACGEDGLDLTGRTRDFDDNIWCGIHVQFGYDTPYDILLSRHQDIDDVMDSFDCNWNQQFVGEKVHLYWRGKNELVFTGKPLRDGREEYIRNKYNEVFNVHNSTGS